MDFDSISFLISDLLLGWILSDVEKPETSVNPSIQGGGKTDGVTNRS
jgi:hypothetical protein